MWLPQSLIALGWVIPAIFPQVHGRSIPDCNGKPRSFELTLTWEKHAPDGFEREMILTNGQFPGPLLEINQGDDVEITLHNKLPFNTTLHYHGIEMLHTPWSDGVPGLSQRHIQPGGTFVYKFKATQFGSYWYHAHERGQLDDGMYGPIIIYQKKGSLNPFSMISKDPAAIRAMEKAEANAKPLVLSDLRHVTSYEAWDLSIASGIEIPCYDSLLFNGKGRVNCWSPEKIDSLLNPVQRQFLALGNETAFTPKACLPASIFGSVLSAGLPTNISALPAEIFDKCTATNTALEVIEVKKSSCSSETWVAFDVIATFGLVTGGFSIDGHPMYVYAVDGDYIEPQKVEAIVVTNGDRYSVMVKLDTTGDFTIRMASNAAAQMIAGYATISYRDPKETTPSNPTPVAYIDDVGVNTTASVRFFDQAKMKSFPPSPISQTADQIVKLSIHVVGQSYNWALNDSSYPISLDAAEPLLFAPKPYLNNNVTISTKNNTWVDLIFQAVQFPQPPHPIHKHGNKMYLIGQGDGLFNYSSVAEAVKAIPQNFNLVDPPKRDGLATPPANTGPTWMAVRYHVSNPGAWLMHCHIQSHLLGGMSMAIQDGVDAWPKVPEEYLNYH